MSTLPLTSPRAALTSTAPVTLPGPGRLGPPGRTLPSVQQDWDDDVVVAEPPDARPGSWAGAPSAVRDGTTTYVAYRLRHPVGEGRGFANVVARSRTGEHLEPIAVVAKDAFDTDSLERPALVRTPEGSWRLYVSVATPGTKHWRIDVVEARTPQGLATATPRTVLPGSATEGVKDPVVLRHRGLWHLWASAHPLDDPDATDRMTTVHAVSEDGIAWHRRGTVLRGTPGTWDARGARITAVILDRVPWAFYDGRASAGENWEERTGIARAPHDLARFEAVGPGPWGASAHHGGGLRYASVVDEPGGRRRLYYEVTRADGAHELRTRLLRP